MFRYTIRVPRALRLSLTLGEQKPLISSYAKFARILELDDAIAIASYVGHVLDPKFARVLERDDASAVANYIGDVLSPNEPKVSMNSLMRDICAYGAVNIATHFRKEIMVFTSARVIRHSIELAMALGYTNMPPLFEFDESIREYGSKVSGIPLSNTISHFPMWP